MSMAFHLLMNSLAFSVSCISYASFLSISLHSCNHNKIQLFSAATPADNCCSLRHMCLDACLTAYVQGNHSIVPALFSGLISGCSVTFIAYNGVNGQSRRNVMGLHRYCAPLSTGPQQNARQLCHQPMLSTAAAAESEAAQLTD